MAVFFSFCGTLLALSSVDSFCDFTRNVDKVVAIVEIGIDLPKIDDRHILTSVSFDKWFPNETEVGNDSEDYQTDS
jgi:hypothetical protein